jgi:hypothetical protein
VFVIPAKAGIHCAAGLNFRISENLCDKLLRRLKPAAQWIPTFVGMTPLARRLGKVSKKIHYLHLRQII